MSSTVQIAIGRDAHAILKRESKRMGMKMQPMADVMIFGWELLTDEQRIHLMYGHPLGEEKK